MFAKIFELKESLNDKPKILEYNKPISSFLATQSYKEKSKTNILNNLQIKQLSMIFSGIFSTVYSVILPQKTLILKCISINELTRIEDRKAAENEYLILQNFEHIGVVKVLAGEMAYDNSQFEILMEYGGENMWKIKNSQGSEKKGTRAKFQEEEIERWFAECIDIGSFLESTNLYYGDFKTGNLLLNPKTNNLQLCDFGTCLYFPNKANFVKSYNNLKFIELIKGNRVSSLYAPPEVLQISNYNYLPKIDVYMMGMMFYELITLKSNPKLAAIAHKREDQNTDYNKFLNMFVSEMQIFGIKENLVSILYSMLQSNLIDRPSFSYLQECIRKGQYEDFLIKLRLNHDFNIPIEVEDPFQDRILINKYNAPNTGEMKLSPRFQAGSYDQADFSKTHILTINGILGPFQTDLLYNNKGTRVYRVSDFEGKNYVVKQLCMQEIDDRKVEEEFSNQNTLNHKNVVQALDLRFSPANNWAEMLIEYGGIPLSDMMENFHALPVETILKYFSQCVAGMRHIESKGIFHGDLKPSNIVISSNDVAKIIDFGASIRLTASQLVATSYEVYSKLKAWTQEYMPPEILKGSKHSSIFEKVDIYNFGMTFYQLLFRISHRTLTEEKNLKCDKADFHITFEENIQKKKFKTEEHTMKFIPILSACLRRESKKRPTFKTLLFIMTHYTSFDSKDIKKILCSNKNFPTSLYYDPSQEVFSDKRLIDDERLPNSLNESFENI